MNCTTNPAPESSPNPNSDGLERATRWLSETVSIPTKRDWLEESAEKAGIDVELLPQAADRLGVIRTLEDGVETWVIVLPTIRTDGVARFEKELPIPTITARDVTPQPTRDSSPQSTVRENDHPIKEHVARLRVATDQVLNQVILQNERRQDAEPATQKPKSEHKVPNGRPSEADLQAFFDGTLKPSGPDDSHYKSIVSYARGFSAEEWGRYEDESLARRNARYLDRTAIEEPGLNTLNTLNTPTHPSEDDGPIEYKRWPEPPDAKVFTGLVGEIVKTIEPHTEADPLGVLATILVMFGNAVGRRPYVQVEETAHHCNEFAVLVGDTAMGRKGTSLNRARKLFETADPYWLENRLAGGLSSGEGLIGLVRDATWKKEPIKEKDRGIVGYQDVIVDGGVDDKRSLVVETEFGGVLRVLDREGNKLVALICQAWDHGNLATATKIPFRATGAHISILGHITADELLAFLSQTNALNGFANRFLWFAVKRARELPFGGRVDVSHLAKNLMFNLDLAREQGEIKLTPRSQDIWVYNYHMLTTPSPGVLGGILSRGAPHVLRLAMLYALSDGHQQIEEEHLSAALALWDAAYRSAAYIFGDSLGDPNAEKILAALRKADSGLTRTEIFVGVFNKHLPSPRIKAALALLLERNLIREQKDTETGGAPLTRYFAA